MPQQLLPQESNGRRHDQGHAQQRRRTDGGEPQAVAAVRSAAAKGLGVDADRRDDGTGRRPAQPSRQSHAGDRDDECGQREAASRPAPAGRRPRCERRRTGNQDDESPRNGRKQGTVHRSLTLHPVAAVRSMRTANSPCHARDRSQPARQSLRIVATGAAADQLRTPPARCDRPAILGTWAGEQCRPACKKPSSRESASRVGGLQSIGPDRRRKELPVAGVGFPAGRCRRQVACRRRRCDWGRRSRRAARRRRSGTSSGCRPSSLNKSTGTCGSSTGTRSTSDAGQLPVRRRCCSRAMASRAASRSMLTATSNFRA